MFLSNANGLSVVRDSRILSVVRDSKMENNPECFRPLPGRLPAKVLGILDCSQQGTASIKISGQKQIWIFFLFLKSLISSMQKNCFESRKKGFFERGNLAHVVTRLTANSVCIGSAGGIFEGGS